ncbi:ComEA family DNA-binding protein, partial [Saccharomonospora iraqiensis]|uniref:ComEA family DNA-binding protein n=1 Tax=Saccharomonospora iraqiensis TaxID=52698 RepID=UPI00022DF185
GTDPAVAAVLAARQRRDKAREVVASDPLMARELRIGRPDLRPDYDDGGLVDLNNAPASALAEVCELDPGTAERIVEARSARGGFLTVDDVFTAVDVPLGAWEMIRDRAVVIPR